MSEFFAMGGYALYVWGSYGVAAVVLVALLLLTLRDLKDSERLLAALETSVPARGARKRNASRAGGGAETTPGMLAMAGADIGGRKPGQSPDTDGSGVGGDGGGGGE